MRILALLLIATCAFVQAGCALAIASAAIGAGTAGYLYYNGLLYRDYHANLGDTMAAVRTSLLELQFPIVKEKTDPGSVYFLTTTGDGHKVHIYLDVVPSPIPAEGALTRVGIRVGFTGDDAVSVRILDQVSRHLVPLSSIPQASSPPPVPPPAAVQSSLSVGPPQPAETAPPPLATPIGTR